MNSSPRRRRTSERAQRGGPLSGTRNRVIAVTAMLAVFGGAVAVTQVSSAGTRGDRDGRGRAADCTNQTAESSDRRDRDRDRCQESPEPEDTTSAPPADPAPGSGLDVLGSDCTDSELAPHEGFQDGSRCVSTAFGEVSDADTNPQLMIISSPNRVRVNQPFTLRVSTRNLVRDRFLPAGQGGYYLESSFLTEDGLTRGHFHTACRMLDSTRRAPQPGPVPAFFVATEDGGGGAGSDEVVVQVPGLPTTGIAQCASWAGDGSHRVPMMQRANQIPAFDVVRVVVTR
ncbi:Pecanex-like protein 1 [Solwaraspora sp. WMMB335]|uniref:Pecanex-like protein 1 n=1 Tax=Solwaraspora sp. WMMB335 TaxID=3404118 RepID=UPI003B961E1C